MENVKAFMLDGPPQTVEEQMQYLRDYFEELLPEIEREEKQNG